MLNFPQQVKSIELALWCWQCLDYFTISIQIIIKYTASAHDSSPDFEVDCFHGIWYKYQLQEKNIFRSYGFIHVLEKGCENKKGMLFSKADTFRVIMRTVAIN